MVAPKLFSPIKGSTSCDVEGFHYYTKLFKGVSACVEVLATSGTPNNAGLPSRSNLEAPLKIYIPNNTKMSNVEVNNQQSTISTQGMNITVPVSIQKQQLPVVSSSKGIDGNVSANSAQPVRKKRKKWTEEEDKELIVAVQKCSEGN